MTHKYFCILILAAVLPGGNIFAAEQKITPKEAFELGAESAKRHNLAFYIRDLLNHLDAGAEKDKLTWVKIDLYLATQGYDVAIRHMEKIPSDWIEKYPIKMEMGFIDEVIEARIKKGIKADDIRMEEAVQKSIVHYKEWKEKMSSIIK